FSYPKEEKLKSRKIIDLLFTEGKSVAKFPLRLMYVGINNDSDGSIKFGVSVSKKYFKKAVDRNYIKRMLREIYRHNKHLLISQKSTYAMMLLYQSRELLAYDDINSKAVALFTKFSEVAERPD
ncbi:MAG TPA: ribonuclease P protein component, partial [Flavobacterium sp.]